MDRAEEQALCIQRLQETLQRAEKADAEKYDPECRERMSYGGPARRSVSARSVSASDEKPDSDSIHSRPEGTGNETIWKEEPEALLWEAIVSLEGETFTTVRGMEYTYRVNGGELFISRRSKSIVRSSVNRAFRIAIDLDREVAGPKKLKIYGASYIYPIFLRLGVIRDHDHEDRAQVTATQGSNTCSDITADGAGP